MIAKMTMTSKLLNKSMVMDISDNYLIKAMLDDNKGIEFLYSKTILEKVIFDMIQKISVRRL